VENHDQAAVPVRGPGGPARLTGPPEAVLKALESARSAALQHVKELGLSPASMVRLGLDIQRGRTMTLAERLATERREREAQASNE
jgi:hypothetical protein